MNSQNSWKKPGGASESPVMTSLEIAGPSRTWRFSLEEGNTWRIGRTSHNDLVLLDDLVSRSHAILQRTEEGCYYLIDMGSSNGSFVNDTRICIPRLLRGGDGIQIGKHSLTYHGPSGVPAEKLPEGTQDRMVTRSLFTPRRITVLVVDVRNFTRLTQLVDQDVLCMTLGTWFRKGGSIMQERGSWGLKYIGDSIMAVWLHQRPGYEQQEIMHALSAYVELARVSASLAAEFSLPFDFRIGAGLNTGTASIGNTGGSVLMDYTAMGDTVNAAFRIESATKEIGVDIAIGQSTRASLARCFQPEHYFQPYQLQLRGYDAPTDIWGTTLQGAQGFVASLNPR